MFACTYGHVKVSTVFVPLLITCLDSVLLEVTEVSG